MSVPLGHGVIGIVAIMLVVGQPVNAWLRPDKAAASRPLWRAIHVYAGRGAMVVGIINVFLGIGVMQIKEKSVDTYAWKVLFFAILTSMCLLALSFELRNRQMKRRHKPKGHRV